MKINTHYSELKDDYLFATVAQKVDAYQKQFPEKKVIRLGIGDVTLPLCAAVVDAMKAAADEMGARETFRGYGPYEGYAFLREALCRYYAGFGVELGADEVFVSEGAKSDLGNILDIFDGDNTVLVPDPVYPVYVDTNIMAGRRVIFSDAREENDFLPLPDKKIKADIIYLCSPNNPTGAAYDRAGLKSWVDYALENDAVILYDAAYECFIGDAALPHSIFEIEGARRCAIEFCSLSKTAGFTGTRCGYTVIPRELAREGARLGALWLRRQSTKYNGVPYVIQRAAEAVFTPEGQRQTKENIAYYKGNAAVIAKTLRGLGIWFSGGVNSPYIWMRCPRGLRSWEFFDLLLTEANVVGTPGAGFGRNGEGFFRLTGFGGRENTIEAAQRIEMLLK